MSEPTEREWLEGLRYEDKFPEPSDHFCPDCREWEGERICPNLPPSSASSEASP